jgi:ABC-type glycerol-3-phosphate transport system substrate-binding protein
VALGAFDNIAHNSDIISLLLLQNGADIKGLNGPARQSAFDALSFYTSFATGDSRVWDGTLENSKLAFAGGRVALYFGYSWDIPEIKALNPNLEFSVLAVPHLPGRNITIASYWVEGISAKTKHAPEAFKFLEFLASRKTLEKRYTQHSKIRLFGELYPREDMAGLLSSNTLIYPFVTQGKDAKSTIFSSDTYDEAMVDSLNSYLGNAIRSIMNDNTSVQTAIETLANGVSQVLGRYEGITN